MDNEYRLTGPEVLSLVNMENADMKTATLDKINNASAFFRTLQESSVVNAKQYNTVYLTSDIHADYWNFLRILIRQGLVEIPHPELQQSILESPSDIYDTRIITDAIWRGGPNTLLVIIGDLVDGARNCNSAVKDPNGFFEVFLMTFLYNLRFRASQQDSNILFTMGNHDFHTLYANTSLIKYVQHKTLQNYGFEHNLDAQCYIATSPPHYGHILPALNERTRVLFPFFNCSPFLYLSIEAPRKRAILCTHGGFGSVHSTDEQRQYYTRLQEQMLRTDNINTILPHDHDVQYILNSTNNNLLWNREYATNPNICPNVHAMGYDMVVVGHCPTDSPMIRTGLFHSDRMKQGPNYDMCDRGCVLVGCRNENQYPGVSLVDITMSEAFGDYLTESIPIRSEFLVLRHVEPYVEGQPYYNNIIRQNGAERIQVVPAPAVGGKRQRRKTRCQRNKRIHRSRKSYRMTRKYR